MKPTINFLISIKKIFFTTFRAFLRGVLSLEVNGSAIEKLASRLSFLLSPASFNDFLLMWVEKKILLFLYTYYWELYSYKMLSNWKWMVPLPYFFSSYMAVILCTSQLRHVKFYNWHEHDSTLVTLKKILIIAYTYSCYICLYLSISMDIIYL